MKRLLTLFIAVLILSLSSNLMAQADKVVGTWLTQEGKSKVRIYKAKNGKYYGKIVWLKEPLENGKPKVDKDNPDDALKSRPLLELLLLKSFEYDEDDKEWADGKIYDPKEGKTYSCYMWFEDNNFKKLHVKGFIGFALIGREVEWTKSELKK